MKDHTTRHDENLNRLARIEGQVRGIRGMVEEGDYCVDIVTQIQAAQSALNAVGLRVLQKHVEHCVTDAIRSGDDTDAEGKVEELMKLLRRYVRR